MGELQKFDYGQLDEKTASFLRQKESNMRKIVGKAYTELGRELYEAQQALARKGSKYEGVFEKWYTSMGFKKRSVYNYINRYKLVQQLHKVDYVVDVEEIPNNLAYEIASPNAESTPAKAQAKAEVLAGEIDTLKEYRERVKQLEKEAEQERKRAEQAERYAEEKENEVERLKSRPKPEPRVEVRTEYVEVEDQKTRERLRKYEERFGDIEDYDERVTASNRQDLTVSVISFNKAVRDLAKRYSYMTQYKNLVAELDEVTRKEYNQAVKVLQELAHDFDFADEKTGAIDAEYVEIN